MAADAVCSVCASGGGCMSCDCSSSSRGIPASPAAAQTCCAKSCQYSPSSVGTSRCVLAGAAAAWGLNACPGSGWGRTGSTSSGLVGAAASVVAGAGASGAEPLVLALVCGRVCATGCAVAGVVACVAAWAVAGVWLLMLFVARAGFAGAVCWVGASSQGAFSQGGRSLAVLIGSGSGAAGVADAAVAGRLAAGGGGGTTAGGACSGWGAGAAVCMAGRGSAAGAVVVAAGAVCCCAARVGCGAAWGWFASATGVVEAADSGLGLLVFSVFFSAVGLNASSRINTMVKPAYSSGASPSSLRPCRQML